VGLSISVFGLGYVGSVSAACFAHVGHRVIGVDVSPAKVEALGAGRSPIVEARMSELLAEGHAAGRLRATTDAAAKSVTSDQVVIDLVNLDPASRPDVAASYQGICW